MRKAQVNRKTKETNITVKLNIDGKGKAKIDTGIGLLDHLLELFAFHGLFDLEVVAKGDFEVDKHHTNEDIGIVLGEAFKKALAKKAGIRRFGSAAVPMEEVVANAVVDLSGRGSFRFDLGNAAVTYHLTKDGSYEFKDAEHFFDAFAKHLGMNLNMMIHPLSADLHTTLEPAFKALGLALDLACQIDKRRKGVPSTKGVID